LRVEVTSKEEVHVLCYFKELANALEFGRVVYDSLPNIKNVPSIFGSQNIYNSNDEVIGILDKLLINASGFTLDEIIFMSSKYGGIAVPAHIDKKSNGILGILGFIPTDYQFKFIELNSGSSLHENLEKYFIIKNSDAHRLIDISEANNYFELDSIDCIYNFLNLK
jgi:hypothetical protein